MNMLLLGIIKDESPTNYEEAMMCPNVPIYGIVPYNPKYGSQIVHELFDFIRGSRLEDKKGTLLERCIFVYPSGILLVIITYFICEKYQNVVPEQYVVEGNCS